MEGSYIWSVRNTKIMWIYATPADAQNKVNVICLYLLYYAHQEYDLLALKIVNSGYIELFP